MIVERLAGDALADRDDRAVDLGFEIVMRDST
jgi:hypothetical protein